MVFHRNKKKQVTSKQKQIKIGNDKANKKNANVIKDIVVSKDMVSSKDSESFSDVENSSDDSINKENSTVTSNGMTTPTPRNHSQFNNRINMVTDIQTMSEKKYQTNNPVLANAYINHCRTTGTMDDESDISEEVKRVTKRFGWKNFKILCDDDWKWDSNFAGMIMRKLGMLDDKEHDSKLHSKIWDTIKKDVVISMQAVKSSATQLMKKNFIGTYTTFSINFQKKGILLKINTSY